MKITLKEVTIREIAENYVDNAEEGVVGYSGRLDIRPKYQREFVYDEKKRNAVIETIRKVFPLNVMYWVITDDGNFEVLDGQQRTISFCQYVNGDFPVEFDGLPKFFSNLTVSEQNRILDYTCMIYFCEGTDDEKLAWFEIINIAGEKLTPQELLNATYTGAWLTSAKSKFSKSNAPAYLLAKDYVNGSPIRQEILETALKWISDGNIKGYMATHSKSDPNANELFTYFQNVINWIKLTFTTYRREMKGLDWGTLYKANKDRLFDTVNLEQQINSLMKDDDVQNKKGVYLYVLGGDDKHLNIRAFKNSEKRTAYERQNGLCAKCGKHFEIEGMEADHIDPWNKGGKTTPENCQMLCQKCNRRKSDM
ncbi:MAG: DUF262 domain-containing protein [Oscillospiraceae bacterium]|nr:DUF262 domain-containing protein [Oscillospiraceae bacterium]